MSEMDKDLVYGRLRINPASRMVYVDENEVALTRMEFDVLFFLASNPNIAFTKDQIYEVVNKETYTDAAYTIRDIVYRLRVKLNVSNIQTLYGYGYKFSTEK